MKSHEILSNFVKPSFFPWFSHGCPMVSMVFPRETHHVSRLLEAPATLRAPRQALGALLHRQGHLPGAFHDQHPGAWNGGLAKGGMAGSVVLYGFHIYCLVHCLYGFCMVLIWFLYGSYMVVIWFSYVLYIVFTWFQHGTYTCIQKYWYKYIYIYRVKAGVPRNVIISY